MPFTLQQIDTLSVSQIAQTIAQLNATEAVGWIRELDARFPGIDWKSAVAAAVESGTVFGELLRAGQAFTAGAQFAAGVAGNAGQMSLFNPTGSGVRALMFQIAIGTPAGVAAAGVGILRSISADTTLALATATPLRSDASIAPTVSHVVVRGDSAHVPIAGATFALRQTGTGGAMQEFGPLGGIPFLDLAPGAGVAIEDFTLTEVAAFDLRWAEIPIGQGPL